MGEEETQVKDSEGSGSTESSGFEHLEDGSVKILSETKDRKSKKSLNMEMQKNVFETSKENELLKEKINNLEKQFSEMRTDSQMQDLNSKVEELKAKKMQMMEDMDYKGVTEVDDKIRELDRQAILNEVKASSHNDAAAKDFQSKYPDILGNSAMKIVAGQKYNEIMNDPSYSNMSEAQIGDVVARETYKEFKGFSGSGNSESVSIVSPPGQSSGYDQEVIKPSSEELKLMETQFGLNLSDPRQKREAIEKAVQLKMKVRERYGDE